MKPLRLSVSVGAAPRTDLATAAEIFHRFIQRSLVEGFILDVADYRHVPGGPGMMIVGQDLDYGLTPDSCYVTLKRAGEDAATQFRNAVRMLLGLVEQIEADGDLPCDFDLSTWSVRVADRSLGAPEEIQQALTEDVASVATALFGDGSSVTAEPIDDPRELPQVTVSAARTDGLLATLGGNQAGRQSAWDITPRELQQLRESTTEFTLLDVREPGEYETVNIDGTLIPLGELDDRIGELDPAAHVVVHCRAGFRGAEAVAKLREQGFENAWNLNGGLMAWVDHVDPSLPKY